MILSYSYDPRLGPQGFLPYDQSLVMPTGTVKRHDGGTWAAYWNPRIRMTWLVYALEGGWKITRLHGKWGIDYNLAAAEHIVRSGQLTGCRGCE